MKKYLYLLVILGSLSIACSDFLDQGPKYNLTLENAVTNYQGAKNIVNGMYSVLTSSVFGGELSGNSVSSCPALSGPIVSVD